MHSIEIIDDIMAPADFILINFRGKNPFIVCGMIPGLIKDVMRITGKDVWETDIRWDITADPRPFYGVWKGKRKEDKWTETFIRVVAQGEQTSKDKTGWIRVELKGTIETKYNYTNFIQKSFWWFFNYMFYFKQRRRYIDWANDNIMIMREKITRQLGIYREEY